MRGRAGKSAPTGYLHGFRPLRVGPALPQAAVAAWLQDALRRVRGGRLDARDRRALALYERFGRSGTIATRVSALADYSRRDPDAMTLFRADGAAPWHRPTLQARMAVYEKTVLRLAGAAFPAGERAPDYAVQVSCTGYASPHAVQRLVARRGWGSRVLHVGHMGCYAAVPAAAMAAGLARAEAARGRRGARAAVFLAELCTLHLKPGENADEQVVVNSLFADGAIRFDASAERRPRSFALLDGAEELLPGTGREMTWRLEDSSFRMTLSREVPRRVGAAVAGFVARLLRRNGLTLAQVGRFAIHPGGPLVIDQVLRALGLPADAAAHSREVLRRRGNMSSATLPHIWSEILEDPAVRDGELTLSLAFGPGLTLAANLLRKER
jgi:predicted naringenin-chalcone synthase